MIFRAVEDADLIQKTRRGDVEAYNLLISRWETRVFNYLLRITRNREDALDLSQDVFLKAYQSIRKLEDPARFGPWLFRIAHNEAHSLFRKRKPESGEQVFSGQETVFHSGPALEVQLAISSALDRLRPEHREVVLLKVFEGFKFEEMAEILDCPVSTVKSRLYAAFDLLKDQLAPVKTRGVS